MLAVPPPNTTTCPDCGESLAAGLARQSSHDCDVEQRLDYIVRRMHAETAAFNAEWSAWLDSPAGRFAVWLAARGRT
jgi:hypothetical protein